MRNNTDKKQDENKKPLVLKQMNMITKEEKFILISEMIRINKGIEFLQGSNDINQIKRGLEKLIKINNKCITAIDNKSQVLPALLSEKFIK